MAAFRAPILDSRLKLKALWLVAIALCAVVFSEAWQLTHFQPAGIDYTPLWTAGHMAWRGDARHVYDFGAVTRAQGWVLNNFKWMRPYAYPPTTLLVLAPFGAAPFWPAYLGWLALGFGLYLAACVRLVGRRRGLVVVLACLAPTTFLALYVGQTVFLAAALLTLAVADLDQHPRRAGAWLALAAALKPQAALLAPVALIAGGAVEALASALVVGIVLFGASVVLFGAARWAEWLSILPDFQAVVEGTPGLMWHVITPAGAAHELGLAGPAAAVWRAAFALLAVVLVWRAFARRGGAAERLAALAAGSLLVTPYALNYDGAILVPAAIALAVGRLERPGWIAAMFALCAVTEVTTPHLGLVCVMAFAVTSALDPRPAPSPRAAAVPAPAV